LGQSAVWAQYINIHLSSNFTDYKVEEILKHMFKDILKIKWMNLRVISLLCCLAILFIEVHCPQIVKKKSKFRNSARYGNFERCDDL